MRKIWNFIKQKLATTQASQKRHADRTRKDSSNYKVEDMIWLSTKNIKTERSSRKLNYKMIDSYKIKKIMKNACQLNLSQFMKIHDTFYISLLRSSFTDSLIEQIQLSSSSIVVNDEEKYEIDDILDSRYHYEKLQYRIAWTEHSFDRAWYSAENFDHVKDIKNDYHRRYFDKFESDSRMIVIIEAMLSQWIRNDHKKAKQLIQDVLKKMKTKMKEIHRNRISKDSFEKNLESAIINTFDRR